MSYLGANQTIVECAEQRKRFGPECSFLRICVGNETTHHDTVKKFFPSDFIVPQDLSKDVIYRLLDDCNVVARDRWGLRLFAKRAEQGLLPTHWGTSPYLGAETVVYDPVALVSRKEDRAWSDILNWVLQALFYGEGKGIGKNFSLCQKSKPLAGDLTNLNFMNAVYCVGSYGEVLGAEEGAQEGRNRINNGTDMIFAIPYGELSQAGSSDKLLDDIRKGGELNCGVFIPTDYTLGDSIQEERQLLGMNIDYCRTLAASLFNGDDNGASLTFFSEHDSNAYDLLNNETIHVLAGARIEKEYDFEQAASSLDGFTFSTPYYYGNERAG